MSIESVVAALFDRITRTNESERLHHERRHHTGSGLKSKGLTTSVGNRSSSSEKDKKKPQRKGSKKLTEMCRSGQDKTNKDIQTTRVGLGSWDNKVTL